MMNRRKNTNYNQCDHYASAGINQRTIEHVQIQPSPTSSTSFDWSWFPFPRFSYMSIPDLADLPNLRRLALMSDLSFSITRQIDYYFSDENLVRDHYLKYRMDNQGWVDVFFIADFSRIKRMTDDIELILDSMRSSTTVEVQGCKLRKRHGWERWIIRRGDMES